MREEVKKRQKDIEKNFTYQSCVGMAGGELIPKIKPRPPNICKHSDIGCDTLPRHKTERSKHCKFYGKSVEYMREIRESNATVQVDLPNDLKS